MQTDYGEHELKMALNRLDAYPADIVILLVFLFTQKEKEAATAKSEYPVKSKNWEHCKAWNSAALDLIKINLKISLGIR